MKQIACVHLPHWPIDRLRRKHSQFQHRSLVLVETSGTKQTITHVSKEARAFGIQPAMPLVQARALCADLADAPHEPDRDIQTLHALARWLMRFSPTVAVESSNALFLDVTGSDHLFGGWKRLATRISEAMRQNSITAATAIAPTPGAAWALAFSKRDGFVIGDQPLDSTLAPLPVESLRIDAATSEMLHDLGIETCRQLLALPRQMLPCRFGDALLWRLNQALGVIPEPLVSVKLFTPLAASMRFETEIESLQMIHVALKHLLENRIIPELTKRGCGAKRIEISFLQSRAAPVLKTLQLSRPSRSLKNLFHLIELSCESAASESGFIGVRIVAKALQRLSGEQIQLMEQEEFIAQRELEQLIERLHALSGRPIFSRPQLVESHIPEHACALIAPNQDSRSTTTLIPSRPPRLLHPPALIGVMVAPTTEGPPLSFHFGGQMHTVNYAIGPERIAGRWWAGHNKTRDYFEIENESGQRFWVFRVVETGKWFLHGSFD